MSILNFASNCSILSLRKESKSLGDLTIGTNYWVKGGTMGGGCGFIGVSGWDETGGWSCIGDGGWDYRGSFLATEEGIEGCLTTWACFNSANLGW